MAWELPRHCERSEAIHRPHRNDAGGCAYPPRTGGIVTWSRGQARRVISAQSWNCRSLPRQMRTSESRVRLQVTAIAEAERPGLALMKAAAMSSGAMVLASDN